jgi:alkylhydroperoxidase family enzyme
MNSAAGDATAISPEVIIQIRAREAEVLGKPPRIPPLDRQSAAGEVREVTHRLRRGVVQDAVELSLDAIPEIMFTLCRYPDLWDKIMALSLQMQSETGVLTPRDRQLAILRTAWLLQAPYEWGEHVRHSKRIGITSEEIEQVIVGSGAPEWNSHERAIMQAAEELRDNVMVSDTTWDQLAKQLDDGQLFELLALIGQFTSVAYIQNSLRLRLEPNNPGLAAR